MATTTPTVWKSLYRVNTTDQPDPVNGHVTATDEQSASKVVALTGGRYLVTWEDWSTQFSGGLEPRDVVGQIYDAFGNKIGGEIALSGWYGDLDQKAQAITPLANGGFMVAYQTT